MSKWLNQFGPVVATVAMLAVIGGLGKLNIATEGLDDFRARSRAAVEALPMTVGSWNAKRQPLDVAARDLLQPNSESTLIYRDSITGNTAYYALVQVKDTRSMVGHAPVNCYPSAGFTINSQADKKWRLGEFDIDGTEYVVERSLPGGKREVWTVRNFFIFPDGTFGSKLADVSRASEDYRRLAYGVMQVQLVTFDPRLTDKQRDDIFYKLVGSEKSLEMIRVLRTGTVR